MSPQSASVAQHKTASSRLVSMSDEAPTFKAVAHRRLEDAILELELPPGMRLIEADLAKRFQVSKTPIREALLLLANDSLVELVPHTGARVTSLSIEEYAQLVDLLDRLELPSLPAITASITSQELDCLDALVVELREAREVEDGVRFRNLLLQMHSKFFETASFPHLTNLIEKVGRLTRRYECAFTHHFPDTWNLELQLVADRIEFFRLRNAEGAARRIREVHGTLTRILQERANHPDLTPYLR